MKSSFVAFWLSLQFCQVTATAAHQKSHFQRHIEMGTQNKLSLFHSKKTTATTANELTSGKRTLSRFLRNPISYVALFYKCYTSITDFVLMWTVCVEIFVYI